MRTERRIEPGVEPALAAHFGARSRVQPLGASGFGATYRVEAAEACYFVKFQPEARAWMLEAEADGLRALAATGAVRVPQVVDGRALAGGGLLALEWLDFAAPDGGFGRRLGERLAALHAAPPGFSSWGWRIDNALGATRQENAPVDQPGRAGWVAFFRERRLGALARRLDPVRDRPLRDTIAALLERLDRFFDDGCEPCPSLIHGDLWSGNWAMLRDGTPVLYDPAVSVSDAEAELAMMELFGAPPAGFWEAYRAHRPLAPGYALRRPLYQLYHLVNHVLLFGDAYRAQAFSLAERCLERVR